MQEQLELQTQNLVPSVWAERPQDRVQSKTSKQLLKARAECLTWLFTQIVLQLGAAGKLKGRNWCLSADLMFAAYAEGKYFLPFERAKEKKQRELMPVHSHNCLLTSGAAGPDYFTHREQL